MREILFRGKRKDNGEWVYGSLQVFKGYSIFDRDVWKNFFTVHGSTVGQYTGLLDKNGRKIFEGDIVDTSRTDLLSGWPNSTLGVVEWDDRIGGFNPFADYDSDCGIFTEANKCLVIGNIYDNPELLEVK